jgi:hypothetical protein
MWSETTPWTHLFGPPNRRVGCKTCRSDDFRVQTGNSCSSRPVRSFRCSVGPRVHRQRRPEMLILTGFNQFFCGNIRKGGNPIRQLSESQYCGTKSCHYRGFLKVCPSNGRESSLLSLHGTKLREISHLQRLSWGRLLHHSRFFHTLFQRFAALSPLFQDAGYRSEFEGAVTFSTGGLSF